MIFRSFLNKRLLVSGVYAIAPQGFRKAGLRVESPTGVLWTSCNSRASLELDGDRDDGRECEPALQHSHN